MWEIVTMLPSANAVGNFIPPLATFVGKNNIAQNMQMGFQLFVSHYDCGWTNVKSSHYLAASL